MMAIRLFLLALLMLRCSVSSNHSKSKSESQPDGDSVQTVQPGWTFDQRVEYIANMVTSTMIGCPDRIWPNFSFENLNIAVLFISHAESRAKILYTKNNPEYKIIDFDYQKIPDEAMGWYGFFELAEGKVVSFDLDSISEKLSMYSMTEEQAAGSAFATIVHESFHQYFQISEMWQENFSDFTSRGDLYPLLSEPRYLRAQILKTITEELKSSRDQSKIQSSAKAKYWFNKWKNSYEIEAKNYTDRDEGTAEYVGELARALAEKGCNAKFSGLLESVERSRSKISSAESYPKLDNESYELGLFAGLMLDALNVADWKMRVNDGESPMDVLFSDATPEQIESDDLKLKNTLEVKINTLRVGSFLRPLS